MSEYSSESIDSRITQNRWARWISDALNPLFAPVYLLLILIWESPVFTWPKLYASLISIFFFILIPLAILVRFKQSGAITSLDVEVRYQRIRPYFFALISYAAGWGMMAWITLEHKSLLQFIIGCYLFNSMIGLLITLRWKISIHTASLTTVISFAWLLYGFKILGNSLALYLVAVLGTILLPVLMWSRNNLRVHSWAEIVTGAITAVALTVIETYIFLI